MLLDAINPSASVAPGSTFSLSGQYQDPYYDGLKITVDYGDGTGITPLPLTPDGSFSLSHVYTTAGTYPLTVTVSDASGGIGTGRLSVDVGTPVSTTPTMPTPVSTTPTTPTPVGTTPTPVRTTPTTPTPVSTTPIVGLSLPPVIDATAGLAFAGMGSFEDTAAGPYKILVDYGDGTGPVTSTLDSAGNIPLSHAYARPGTYVATVGVTDPSGGVGLQLAAIRVSPTLPVSGLGMERDAFAIALYRDLLGRVPTPAEVTQVARRLRGPGSYPLAALRLLAGVKYRQLQRTHQGTGISLRTAYRTAIAARNQAKAATLAVKHFAAKAARPHGHAHQ